MEPMRPRRYGQSGFTDSNLMPIAASVVVVVYLTGVIARRDTAPWYEWAGALAGTGGAIWFWIWAFMQNRRTGRRGSDGDGSQDPES